MLQVYWFKDGKQISKRSEHYRISRDVDGTCSLHTVAASLDDDGNYTIMAGNPVVSGSPVVGKEKKRKGELRKRVLNETGSHQSPDEGQTLMCYRAGWLQHSHPISSAGPRSLTASAFGVSTS